MSDPAFPPLPPITEGEANAPAAVLRPWARYRVLGGGQFQDLDGLAEAIALRDQLIEETGDERWHVRAQLPDSWVRIDDRGREIAAERWRSFKFNADTLTPAELAREGRAMATPGGKLLKSRAL